MNSTAIYSMGYYYKHTVYDGSSVLYLRGYIRFSVICITFLLKMQILCIATIRPLGRKNLYLP